MLADCPCCKEWKKMTRHHDKKLKQVILVCRDCHDVIEEYIKVQAKAKKHLKKTKSKK